MQLWDELRVASKFLLDKVNPNMNIKVKSGERIKLSTLAEDIRNVADWVAPDLEQGSVAKVVRCKNCMYYRKYRYRGPKGKEFRACKLTKIKRDPMFFCSDGEEK